MEKHGEGGDKAEIGEELKGVSEQDRGWRPDRSLEVDSRGVWSDWLGWDVGPSTSPPHMPAQDRQGLLVPKCVHGVRPMGFWAMQGLAAALQHQNTKLRPRPSADPGACLAAAPSRPPRDLPQSSLCGVAHPSFPPEPETADATRSRRPSLRLHHRPRSSSYHALSLPLRAALQHHDRLPRRRRRARQQRSAHLHIAAHLACGEHRHEEAIPRGHGPRR